MTTACCEVAFDDCPAPVPSSTCSGLLQIQHLDGHSVVLQSTGITIPGQQEVIKGEGMPLLDQAKKFGDLHVTYTVEFPKSLSEGQRKCIHELESNFAVKDEL